MQIITKTILHTLIWLLISLAVMSLVFVDDYLGNRFRHFSMEMTSVLLCLASVMFLITLAMGGKYKLLPYIGMAFLAAGIVDLFHALFSLGLLVEPKSEINRFIPGSWTAARVLVGLILLHGMWHIVQVKRSGYSLLQSAVSTILMSILVVAVFTVADLPAFIRVEADYLNRPWEIMAIVLYLLLIFFITRHWKKLGKQDKDVILCLTPFLLLSIGYEVLMVGSPVLYGPGFDAAHSIKIMSFVTSFYALGVIILKETKHSIAISGLYSLSIISIVMMSVLMVSVIQVAGTEYLHHIEEKDEQELEAIGDISNSLHRLRYELLSFLISDENKHIVSYDQEWSILQKKLARKPVIDLEVEYNISVPGLFVEADKLRAVVFRGDYNNMPGGKSTAKSDINRVFSRAGSELEDLTRSEFGNIEDVGDAMHRESQWYLLIQLAALIFVLPGFYLFGMLTNKKLVSPVLGLTAFTETVQLGKAESYTVDSSNNEIGILSRNIVKMVDELHEGHAHLEKEVESRTRQLLQSEQRMQQFFSAATEGLIFHKDGVILDVNVSATKVIGYQPEEMVGGKFLDLIPEEYHEMLLDRIARQADDPWKIQVLHKLGHLVDVEVQASTAEYMGEKVRIVSVRDISERVKVEKKALLLGEELELLIETANAPIFGVDKKGFINEWNNKIATLMGYSKDEVINCHLVNEFIHNDYKKSVRNILNQALQGEEVSNYAVPMYTKHGQRLMMFLNATARRDLQGNITGVISVGQDITELDAYRLEMERKVEERTRELNAIFTLSPDGFVLFDSVEKIVYVNPAFLAMTGFSKDSLIYATREEFNEKLYSLMEDDPNNSERKLFDLDTDTDTDTVILELARPDKKILSCASRSMHDTYDVFHGKVLYFRDVTYETEVDRMKSEFLSTAAHELRTPLASIYGFSELLMERDYDKGTSEELYEIIHRQSSNLVKLVNELLDLARIEDRSGKGFNIVRTPLNAVIDRAASSFKLQQNDEHQLTTNLMDDVEVYVDSDKLEQALSNVIGNAYKYSPDSEEIQISSFIGEKDGEKHAGITVIDHGIGMDDMQLSRIYDRFYRADDTGNIPGTGLGMSLVKEIIEVMGGSVQVESTLGKGTAVTLWLKLFETNYHEEAKA